MPQNATVYAEGELADKVIMENCQGDICVRIFKAWDIEFTGRHIIDKYAEQDLYPTAYSHYKSAFGYGPTEECDNDCEHCAYLECPKEPCEDAISREDAIKAQCEACDICGNMRYTKCQYFTQGCNEVKCLRDLPSVRPQEPKSCEKCLYAEETDGSHCYECVKGESKFEQEPCEDAISRQAVLEIIKSHIFTDDYLAVEQLPSVQTKAKTGYWTDTGSGNECSVCHEIQYGYDTGRYFCANCGAEMKGGAE